MFICFDRGMYFSRPKLFWHWSLRKKLKPENGTHTLTNIDFSTMRSHSINWLFNHIDLWDLHQQETNGSKSIWKKYAKIILTTKYNNNSKSKWNKRRKKRNWNHEEWKTEKKQQHEKSPNLWILAFKQLIKIITIN